MQESNIQTAADILWKTINEGGTCSPVRELIGTENLELAYRVQEINTQRKLDRGERIIGAKIGLTSEAVQKQLGVSQPDYGMLTTSMHFENSATIPWNVLHQPKAETEIGFILKRDIEGEVTLDSLKEAIGAAVPSIEIVGSRIENWDIRITDTIADNASASHFVIGKPIEDWESLDLENCRMEMKRGSDVVSTGVGKACLGNPINAALWLAQTLLKLDIPLKEGYIILAGALGPMVPAEPGDEFTARIEGFGDVSVSFGTAE